MKKILTTLFLAAGLLLIANCGWAQDSIPFFKIGNFSVFNSEDTIVCNYIDGIVSFDAESNSITLCNATISENLNILTDDITIKLQGSNSLKCLTVIPDRCTISGPGYVQIGSNVQNIAVYAPRTEFIQIIDGATVEIEALSEGICTVYDNIFDEDPRFTSCVVNNSNLSILAPICFDFIYNWWLVNCKVMMPSDVEYNPNNHVLVQNGQNVSILNNVFQISSTVSNVYFDKPNVHIRGDIGGVIVEGIDEKSHVEVFNMFGQKIIDNMVNGITFIPVPQGMYIVSVNHRATKVIVR